MLFKKNDKWCNVMRIIASDYDGTFNHGGIDDVKLKAVKEWRDRGNLFGFVTGRGVNEAVELIDSNNIICDFIVANNGAVILKPDLTILSDIKCDSKTAYELIEFLFETGCPFVAVNNDEPIRIYNNNSEEIPDDGYTINSFPVIRYFNQISTMLDNDVQAELITKKIHDKFGAILNPLQNGRCIDIVSKDVNKASGIYKLLELLGAEYNDVIAVGDNINDADMIEEFYSYAMENAVDTIKKSADRITPGIAELIYKELSE